MLTFALTTADADLCEDSCECMHSLRCSAGSRARPHRPVDKVRINSYCQMQRCMHASRTFPARALAFSLTCRAA